MVGQPDGGLIMPDYFTLLPRHPPTSSRAVPVHQELASQPFQRLALLGLPVRATPSAVSVRKKSLLPARLAIKSARRTVSVREQNSLIDEGRTT